MPPVFQTGFRSFFLAAGAYAAVVVPVWVAAWLGLVALPVTLPGPVWHAHEMLLGFTGAVIAGFLLTAVRNWTGRPTLSGWPLAALVAVWVAGRVVGDLGAPPALAAAVDGAFYLGLAVGIGRPLLAAGDRRNVGFLVPVLGLGALDATVHLLPGHALVALRGALDLVVVVIAVITSRIVPAFTANALPEARVVRRPWLDRVVLVGVVGLVAAELAGLRAVEGVAAGVAGVGVLARGAGWGVRAASRVPLLGVLHLGHAWLGVGLLLRAAEVGGLGVSASSATHALTVGSVGCLTLGMMARVSLGHTGRPLVAPLPALVAFALVGTAAVLRQAAAVSPSPLVLAAAGAAFGLGFAVWTASQAPALLAARVDGRPG